MSPHEMVMLAERMLNEQEQELVRAGAAQAVRVSAQYASGSGDIDDTFALQRTFRLVYLRCHFSGTPGTAALTIAVESGAGSAYNAELTRVADAGTDNDVNFRVPAGELVEPSPWTLQTGDAVRVRWTNPDFDRITWGLEIGLAPARPLPSGRA